MGGREREEWERGGREGGSALRLFEHFDASNQYRGAI